MLSDEERKAVDKIKTLIQYLNVWKENFTIVPEDVKYLVTILNLIEKQSKEIEELKEKDDANLAYYDQIYQNGIYTGQKAVEDKIKAKIEEIDFMIKEINQGHLQKYTVGELLSAKRFLQSLLEKE